MFKTILIISILRLISKISRTGYWNSQSATARWLNMTKEVAVGSTDDRAKKDAYNREKGIRRLERAYKHGALTKGNINKRGYNKFLSRMAK